MNLTLFPTHLRGKDQLDYEKMNCTKMAPMGRDSTKSNLIYFSEKETSLFIHIYVK